MGTAIEALPPTLLDVDETELTAIELAEPQELARAVEEPLAVAGPESLLSRGKSGTGLSLDADFASLTSGRSGRAVEFFGTVAHGRKIVFILDVSGSMGDNRYRQSRGGMTRFERARDELVRTISQLYADQEFVVLLFSSGCRPMFDLPLRRVKFYAATPHHKDRIGAWLEKVYPGGSTDPRSSIRTALELYPDAIFLLSDGEFKGPRGPISDQVIRLVRGLNTHDVPIHTIAYQDYRSRRTLEAIADMSGGTFRFVE
jgi:uncharacterized protein with von Willebrand factor type A (vWA) domain